MKELTIENINTITKIKELCNMDGGAELLHNATNYSLGFGIIHYALVSNLQPKHILVLGSKYGYIPSCIAMALKVISKNGMLDFVDANYDDAIDGFQVAFGGVGFWDNPLKTFKALGLEKFVTPHIERTNVFFEKLARNTRYQYVYIDAAHDYEGIKYDFEQACKFVESGTFISFHDTLVANEHFGVKKLFDEIDINKFNKFSIPIWPGLGFVQLK